MCYAIYIYLVTWLFTLVGGERPTKCVTALFVNTLVLNNHESFNQLSQYDTEIIGSSGGSFMKTKQQSSLRITENVNITAYTEVYMWSIKILNLAGCNLEKTMIYFYSPR